MEQQQLSWITNFIWGIADDILRDVYVRGKYRDVILPMTVLRRLDAVLEDTKQRVIEMKRRLDETGVENQELALRMESGLDFYNTAPFTLKDLRNRASVEQLKADFTAYLDGFSPNVQDILNSFEFRNQIPRLFKGGKLHALIEKYLDPAINLSPKPVLASDGTVKAPGLDNHAMGTIFEELVRRFNEESNEEAGEHWTPRDAVELMAMLILLPIADQIESGTYLLYDGACGTGGMVTVGEEKLLDIAKQHGKQVTTHLYGQEINAETYAICKADLLLKGEGEAGEHIVGGSDCSTLSNDKFRHMTFDFMMSNPPYGKSWKSDLDLMGGKEGFNDPRFIISHAGDPEYSLLTRTSDGQMLFLANMVSKMKRHTPLGSRIAEVHNGSSLFTGDAGQGESNIRRWIIENDWLEAIIALPLNMFYNTGIATYIWVLSNRKPAQRCGKVQLIDATQWYKPLRKNLGQKNCELSPDDIKRICAAYLNLEESELSRIFPNKAFGYWKISVERPLRLSVRLTVESLASFRRACAAASEEPLANLIEKMADADAVGVVPHMDYNAFLRQVEETALRGGVKLTAKRLKLLQSSLAQRDESALPVIRKAHKLGQVDADPLHGLFNIGERVGDDPRVVPSGKHTPTGVVEYEPDADLRDTEQIPLLEEGGIEAFFQREVLPHVPDAWIDPDATRIGYEINFNRYFYKPAPMRTLAEIRADIVALEQETEGLLGQIIGGGMR